MLKNKIEGITPFNGFFFKNCYYDQLVNGLSALGVDKDRLIENSFVAVKSDFIYEDYALIKQNELGKYLGYTEKKCNLNLRSLKRYIDKGAPVIVGVDCYYLESRSDTYNVTHAPHYILVYGYDTDSDTAYVVDHEYKNSFEYLIKEISLKNLLYANAKFKNGIVKKRFTCTAIIKTKNAGFTDLTVKIDPDTVEKNMINSAENLDRIAELLTDEEKLKSETDRITKYLIGLKSWLSTYAHLNLFADNVKHMSVMQLVSAYMMIVSLFWKIKAQDNYAYAAKNRENVIKKIKEIKALEKVFYGYLTEAAK